MEQFVIGLCMGGLVACILYWERRADKRWAEKNDVYIPPQQRRYMNDLLDDYRNIKN